jgi:diguanylate cyclase (GGDEF)-like protein/PAS domain S-box-containing protein
MLFLCIVTNKNCARFFLIDKFINLKTAKPRILVMHDKDGNTGGADIILKEGNYDVTTANSWDRGVAVARKMPPELIILDASVNRAEALDVCRRLKFDEKISGIPVIFISAKTDEDDIREFFEAGAADHVSKPIVKSELIARVKSHAGLRLSDVRHHMLAAALDKYVPELVIDNAGRILYASTAFQNLTAYKESDLLGKNIGFMKHPDLFRSFEDDILDSLKNNYMYYKEISVQSRYGKKVVLNLVLEPVCLPDGEVVGAQCIMTDLTCKKELEHLSITDKLTGLFNRQKLDEVLGYELSQSIRYGSKFSIVILDMDDFKKVNEKLGHLVGDHVLVKLAAILKTCFRDSDTVGRWGGEEFLVVLPKASEEEAVVVAEKIRKLIENGDFDIEGKITASLGTATNRGDITVATMLANADKALYRAKKTGKNKVVSSTGLNE